MDRERYLMRFSIEYGLKGMNTLRMNSQPLITINPWIWKNCEKFLSRYLPQDLDA